MKLLDLDLSWIHDVVTRPEHIPCVGSTLSKEASLKTANLWPSVLGEDSSILYCSLDELLTTQVYLSPCHLKPLHSV